MRQREAGPVPPPARPRTRRLVVVGASLGGLSAVGELLAGLPAGYRLSVVVVQHRAERAAETLVELWQRQSALPVGEATDREALRAGRVYVAPAGYHLLVEGDRLALSTEAPVLFARPSVDVLFESAAWARRSEVVGVVLTGASEDGARGLAAVRRRGGLGVVQDPATAERREMPEAALALAGADAVLPPAGIGALLAALR